MLPSQPTTHTSWCVLLVRVVGALSLGSVLDGRGGCEASSPPAPAAAVLRGYRQFPRTASYLLHPMLSTQPLYRMPIRSALSLPAASHLADPWAGLRPYARPRQAAATCSTGTAPPEGRVWAGQGSRLLARREARSGLGDCSSDCTYLEVHTSNARSSIFRASSRKVAASASSALSWPPRICRGRDSKSMLTCITNSPRIRAFPRETAAK
jgi:hypothetical protein